MATKVAMQGKYRSTNIMKGNGILQRALKGSVVLVGRTCFLSGIHYTQRTDYQLLGSDTGEQANIHPPVEPKRIQSGSDSLADVPEPALLLLLRTGQTLIFWIVAQGPDDDGGNEDGGCHLLKILPALLPGMAADSFGCGDAVGRKLHHEGEAVIPDKPFHHQRRQNSQDHSEQVDAHQRQRRALGEEGAHKQHEYRQPARAGHKRNQRDGYQTALAALYGAGGHYGRHIAAEAHHHGDEALAVKAEPVHQFIHYEGSAGHVSGILHY